MDASSQFESISIEETSWIASSIPRWICHCVPEHAQYPTEQHRVLGLYEEYSEDGCSSNTEQLRVCAPESSHVPSLEL